MSSKCFRRLKNFLAFQRQSLGARNESNLWYPDYLNLARSDYPEYETINIQIKGYDFPVLEYYNSKIKWIAKKMKLNITDSWVQELQKLKVLKFKPASEIVDAEYILNIYERNTQVSGVYSYEMPILINLVMTICPPGVKVSFHPHTDFHYDNRFVPNYKVLELVKKMEEIGKKK